MKHKSRYTKKGWDVCMRCTTVVNPIPSSWNMLDFAAVSLVFPRFRVSSGWYVQCDQILEKTEEKSFRRQAAKLDDGVLGFRWKNCEQDGTSRSYVQSNYASSQKNAHLFWCCLQEERTYHVIFYSLLSHLCASAYFTEIVNFY